MSSSSTYRDGYGRIVQQLLQSNNQPSSSSTRRTRTDSEYSEFSLPLPISLSLHSSSSSSITSKNVNSDTENLMMDSGIPSSSSIEGWRSHSSNSGSINHYNNNNNNARRREYQDFNNPDRMKRHHHHHNHHQPPQQSRYFPNSISHPLARPPLSAQQNANRRQANRIGDIETDPAVLNRRQKQITYGKNTKEYQNYIQRVPIETRGPHHPRTPPITRKYSRRAFDGLVKQWRLNLHGWSVLDEQIPFNFDDGFMFGKEAEESCNNLISLSSNDQHNESFNSERSEATTGSTSTTSSMASASLAFLQDLNNDSKFFPRTKFSASNSSTATILNGCEEKACLFGSGSSSLKMSNGGHLSLSTTDLDKHKSLSSSLSPATQQETCQLFTRPSSSISRYENFHYSQPQQQSLILHDSDLFDRRPTSSSSLLRTSSQSNNNNNNTINTLFDLNVFPSSVEREINGRGDRNNTNYFSHPCPADFNEYQYWGRNQFDLQLQLDDDMILGQSYLNS